MKKLFDLQLFADDAQSAADSNPVTAEKNEDGAAAEQGKGNKDTKASNTEEKK